MEPPMHAASARERCAKRRALAGSLAPSALPIKAAAAMETPKLGIKATTMVFATIGNVSRSTHPATVSSQSRPAKKRFNSQPHHSQSMRTPPGRANFNISPQPLQAARMLHDGQVAGSGRTHGLSSKRPKACMLFANVYASGAPTNPNFGINTIKPNMLMILAEILATIGKIIIRWAVKKPVKSSLRARDGSAATRQSTNLPASAATAAGCLQATRMSSVLIQIPDTSNSKTACMASCRCSRSPQRLKFPAPKAWLMRGSLPAPNPMIIENPVTLENMKPMPAPAISSTSARK
mmetsp:Transcript_14187/g.26507  ORF Transcript_14187/g.26507 Transcript_14187/m.26507 type:complete len:293 (-) Transcript_14187:29-907(-)